MERNTEFLKTLMSTYGCAGNEYSVGYKFAEEIYKTIKISKSTGTSEVKQEFIDNANNFCFSKGNGPKKVMLSGHSDWIAFACVSITDNGFLHITNVGGSDRRTLMGANVVIVTDDYKYINGIVSIKPIHVIKREERNIVDEYKDILVDVGCSTKDEVEKLGIEIGNPIYFNSNNVDVEFGSSKNQIVGTALDDRIGLYITAEVMKRVNNKNVTLYGVANSQEEVGLRGAEITASRINPDISIDIDVCASTEKEFNINKNTFGDVELGKGPVIVYGPDKNIGICRELKSICKANNIKYQVTVTKNGGTNTAAIQTHAFDCETALISIPNRNMHTQVEMCNWNDVDGAIELLTKYINNI